MSLSPPFFPTPFNFDAVLAYLASLSGFPYSYYYSSVPTDAASYAANVTWTDSRMQPTWAYLTTGAGWTAYSAYYQINAGVTPNQAEAVCDYLNSIIPSTPAARSPSIAARSLNTSFQISSTRDAIVNYSLLLAAVLSLTTGQTETASLQISADNSTFTEVARFSNGNTGVLAIGLGLTQSVGGVLSGFVPAGYYVKLVTSGNGTASYITGQEVLL